MNASPMRQEAQDSRSSSSRTSRGCALGNNDPHVECFASASRWCWKRPALALFGCPSAQLAGLSPRLLSGLVVIGPTASLLSSRRTSPESSRLWKAGQPDECRVQIRMT
jgi:hypothetical protein